MSRLLFSDPKSITLFSDRNMKICLVNEELDITTAIIAIRYQVQAVMVHEGSRYSHGGILLSGNDITLICIPKDTPLPNNGETEYLPIKNGASWKYGHTANLVEYRENQRIITIRNPQRRYDLRSGPLLAYGLHHGLQALGYKIYSSGIRPEGGMIFSSEESFASDLKIKCEDAQLRDSYLQNAITWLDKTFISLKKKNEYRTPQDCRRTIYESLRHTTLIHWDYATTLEKIATQTQLSKSQLAQISMYFATSSVLGWRVSETSYGDQSKSLKVRQPTRWPSASCSKDIEGALRYVATTHSTIDGIYSCAQIIAVKEWNLFVVQTMLSRLAYNQ